MKKGTIALLSAAAGAAAGVMGKELFGTKPAGQSSERANKFKSYYNLLNQWLILKQEGKNLEQYFVDHDYQTIAIYGMGELGSRLCDELNGSSIEIAYAIDKNAEWTNSELKVCGIDDELQTVDAVVVTAVFAFDEIEEMLADKIECPIISLSEIVFELE